MRIALILVLIAIGSVLFHLLTPWWWTPIASNWVYIDHTVTITFWITGVVFTAVVLFVAYCLFRFSHKPGQRAAYQPESKKLEGSLTLLTALGVVAMLAPGLIVWDQYITVPKGAQDVEVVGAQWQWAYRLPGKDGKLGSADNRLISADNPLGINQNDPAGKDDVIIQGDDLHLQVDKPVKIILRSVDVIHDFFVPQFRAKMDMIPGMITYYWFTPTRTGPLDILCAEYCGTGHAYMRGKVVVDTTANYQAWLGQQKTFAELMQAAKSQQAAVAPAGAVQQATK